MNQVVPHVGDQLPTKFEPAKTKRRLSEGDAIKAHAHRMRDWDLLTKAVNWQIKEQAQFVAWWQARVRPNGMKAAIADKRYLAVSEAETLTEVKDDQVSRWRQRLADEARYRELLMKPSRRTASGSLDASLSSETNEWYTPPKYLESVRRVFGGTIDLDPASSERANRNVKAATIFTAEDKGELLPWFGRVFLNPPYGVEKGASRAALFCNKAIREVQEQRVSECVILVNSVHAQSWQAPLFEFPLCLVDHRIQFMDEDGEINPNPTFMNMFVYLGAKKREFASEFAGHGYVVERLRVA